MKNVKVQQFNQTLRFRCDSHRKASQIVDFVHGVAGVELSAYKHNASDCEVYIQARFPEAGCPTMEYAMEKWG